MTQPNSLKPCPFCGGPLEAKVIAEGLHAEGWCGTCAWSMEEWSGDLNKLIERMNRRPAATDGSALVQAADELWVAVKNWHGKFHNERGHEWVYTSTGNQRLEDALTAMQAALTTQKAAGTKAPADEEKKP